MRILAGSYRGKRISAGFDHSIRPMTNKNKESIFAVLGDFFSDQNVLDLFCGSGNLGLESLSRGAACVTFVERDKNSLTVLRDNIKSLTIESSHIKIIAGDVLSFLKETNSRFRLIFADPPFNYDKLQNVVEAVFKHQWLDSEGILVLHHEKTNPIYQDNDQYRILKQKKTGRSLITFLAQEKIND